MQVGKGPERNGTERLGNAGFVRNVKEWMRTEWQVRRGGDGNGTFGKGTDWQVRTGQDGEVWSGR